MSFELDAIRARFPSLSITDDGMPRIYFDNPAGTQVPTTVMNAMTDCLLNANANLGGGFETSRRADAILADAHAAMADFLNAASANEIVFGQNMTTLTLHVSRSIGRLLQPGDEIIVSRMDHDANIAPWLLLAEDLDLRIRWLEFDATTCEFDLARLDDLLTERTRLLCVGGASNLTGTINDIAAMTQMAHEAGAMIYVDAVQLAPHVPIDVQALGCDFLACSAYKFFGPHQGILYGRLELLEQLVPYKVRPAPERPPGKFETGTQSHEGMAGTTAAVDYFASVGAEFAGAYHERNAGYPGRRGHVRAALQYFFDYEATLAAHLIDGLKALRGVKIHGITDSVAFDRRVPTVAFTVDGMAPADIARDLAGRNIFVWSGHNYAVEVARTLGILEAGGAVRVGPVHYNGNAEVDRLLNALEDLLPSGGRQL
ncbi:MAG: cysteine desulfurase-like protein [Woeseiaceae bacterium]|nr:cysteine desulfurase-like protein [Woeseiaceae bacterium]